MNIQWSLLPMIWFVVTLRSFRKCLSRGRWETLLPTAIIRSIAFNYCVLDEGHIIRNPKTKLSKAIRQISAGKGIIVDESNYSLISLFSLAVHRLILSGTPIQNNALELWILFDFLMPGYLGSEKQFIRRYQKPLIASSRDRDLEHGRTETSIGISPYLISSLSRTTGHGCSAQTSEAIHVASPEDRCSRWSPAENSPRLLLWSQLYSMLTLRRLRQSNETTSEPCGERFQQSEWKLCHRSRFQGKNDWDRPDWRLIRHGLELLRHCNICENSATIHRWSWHQNIRNGFRFRASWKTRPLVWTIFGCLANYSLSSELSWRKMILLDDSSFPDRELLIECGIGVSKDAVVSTHRALVFCQMKIMIDVIINQVLG